MADERPDAQERTESPTARRLQQARDEGRVARSQELSSVAVLLSGAVLLAFAAGTTLSGYAASVLRESARQLAAGPMSTAAGTALIRDTVARFVVALLPFALGVMGAVALVNLVQARGVLTLKPITPQLERISPLAGLKRLFSMDAVVALLKAAAKLLALSAVTWTVLAGATPQLLSLAQIGPAGLATVLRSLAFRLAVSTGLAFLVIALADYVYQVMRLRKNLRMSRQEVIREHRETEGDPMVKARILSVMRARARQRMLQQVPRADVVVVNPTEIAVALRYDADAAPAPLVLAMGRRKLAERIRDLAKQAGIPIVENRPVARALIATAVVGKPIPPALYAAVAEILAFVYRKRGRLPSALRAERSSG